MKIDKIASIIGFYIKLFIVIYGFTMVTSAIFMLIYRAETVSLRFIFNAMLFSIAAILPTVVEINIEDKSEKEIFIRRIIHLILNEVVLLPVGYKFEMWYNLKTGILMAVAILLVTFGVSLVIFGRDALMASKINSKLKKFQDKVEV